jgi:hypothetical protein
MWWMVEYRMNEEVGKVRGDDWEERIELKNNRTEDKIRI